MRRRQRELARHRPGPRDPWLNEVAVALADLGLREIARNTGSRARAAPRSTGTSACRPSGLLVYVNLFSDQRLARQAELGLRAKPEVRAAIANGATAIRTAGRVVFVANGRGGVVDEFRLDEVVRVVGRIAVPPPLQPAPAALTAGCRGAGVPTCSSSCASSASCGQAGVLTDAEFEAKKAELLGRI